METEKVGRRYGEKRSNQNMGEFKRLAITEKPKNIVYIIAQSIPARNLTALKLILPCEGTQYIFTDCAKGNRQLQDADLQIFSYWTT